MVSAPHEAQHRIFQENPGLFASAFRVLDIPFPDPVEVSLMDTDLTEMRPLERHVDTLLRVEVKDGSSYLLAIEAQGKKDLDKPSSWAYYLAHLFAKYRYPPILLVLCRDKSTAAWAADPIRIGLPAYPALTIHPLVLGPHNVPAITDPDEAAADVPLAVFSAITHGNDPDAAAILEALASALDSTDPESAAVFAEFTEAGLGDTPARDIWRQLMSTSLSHFRGIVAETFREEGRVEGRAEGREEGREEARRLERSSFVIRTLEIRGIPLTDAHRARISEGADLDQLARWIERAFHVATADELFLGEGDSAEG